jgi:hypothetical protein
MQFRTLYRRQIPSGRFGTFFSRSPRFFACLVLTRRYACKTPSTARAAASTCRLEPSAADPRVVKAMESAATISTRVRTMRSMIASVQKVLSNCKRRASWLISFVREAYFNLSATFARAALAHAASLSPPGAPLTATAPIVTSPNLIGTAPWELIVPGIVAGGAVVPGARG